MNPKEIGAFLKQLRKEKGITQEQLAEILGVSGRTVSRWETGTNLPDLSILVQISEYYNVEMKDLIISLVCVGIFSIVFYLMLEKHMAVPQALGIAVCFFAVLSAISYALLRGIAYLSQKVSDKLKDLY